MATNVQNSNPYSNIMPQKRGVKDFSLASLIGDELPAVKEPTMTNKNGNSINTINPNLSNFQNKISEYFQGNLNNIDMNDEKLNKKLFLISMILDKSFEFKDNNYLSLLDKCCNVNNNPLLPFSNGNYDTKINSNSSDDGMKSQEDESTSESDLTMNDNVQVKEEPSNTNQTKGDNKNIKIGPVSPASPITKYNKLKRNRPTKFSIGNIPFKNDCYCNICNKVFNRKYDLRRHVRLHTNNTPYKCKACGRSFARSDYLKNHIRGNPSCLHSEHYQEKFSK